MLMSNILEIKNRLDQIVNTSNQYKSLIDWLFKKTDRRPLNSSFNSWYDLLVQYECISDDYKHDIRNAGVSEKKKQYIIEQVKDADIRKRIYFLPDQHKWQSMVSEYDQLRRQLKQMRNEKKA